MQEPLDREIPRTTRFAQKPWGAEPAPLARTCPAWGARAAGCSVQNPVEEKGKREGGCNGWCKHSGLNELAIQSLTAFFLEGQGWGGGRGAVGSPVWFLPSPGFLSLLEFQGTG